MEGKVSTWLAYCGLCLSGCRAAQKYGAAQVEEARILNMSYDIDKYEDLELLRIVEPEMKWYGMETIWYDYEIWFCTVRTCPSFKRLHDTC